MSLIFHKSLDSVKFWIYFKNFCNILSMPDIHMLCLGHEFISILFNLIPDIPINSFQYQLYPGAGAPEPLAESPHSQCVQKQAHLSSEHPASRCQDYYVNLTWEWLKPYFWCARICNFHPGYTHNAVIGSVTVLRSVCLSYIPERAGSVTFPCSYQSICFHFVLIGLIFFSGMQGALSSGPILQQPRWWR